MATNAPLVAWAASFRDGTALVFARSRGQARKLAVQALDGEYIYVRAVRAPRWDRWATGEPRVVLQNSDLPLGAAPFYSYIVDELAYLIAELASIVPASKLQPAHEILRELEQALNDAG